MAKQKYYVVWKGKEPGVYSSWRECERQIRNFDGAVYKSFKTKELAGKAYLDEPRQYIGRDMRREERTDEEKLLYGDPIEDSICVDAACSGNPGKLEYRGVDTLSGAELFRQGPFQQGTVNIGEFLAVVHALAYLKERDFNFPIYSDSRTAMKWVRDKKTKTKLEPAPENKKLFNLIERAEKWLADNEYTNPILKWETAVWGEIPADFGRK
ncbi:MAG: ribonuclease H family protein [Bacteroidota bacterium]|nr:ribonuclease H family protein [Bacteroidota bacterium]